MLLPLIVVTMAGGCARNLPTADPVPARTVTPSESTSATPPALTPSTSPPPVPPPPSPTPTGCPADPATNQAILNAARQLNGGALPLDTQVAQRRCTAGYLGARLNSADAGPAMLLLQWEAGAWAGLAFGSFVCDEPAVQSTPSEVQRLVNC